MACICAPSLDLLDHEMDVLHPGRSTASDGCCSSTAHQAQNPFSDHDDGEAKDITRDVAHGVISAEWMEAIKDDPRVKYLIRDKLIYNRSIADRWRPYTGSNPHDKHGHVSINPWSRDDLRPWLIGTSEGDLSIMDDATKAYLDAQFNGVTQRQRRARESQLLQGRRILKLLGNDAEMEADLARIEKELKDEED